MKKFMMSLEDDNNILLEKGFDSFTLKAVYNNRECKLSYNIYPFIKSSIGGVVLHCKGIFQEVDKISLYDAIKLLSNCVNRSREYIKANGDVSLCWDANDDTMVISTHGNKINIATNHASNIWTVRTRVDIVIEAKLTGFVEVEVSEGDDVSYEVVKCVEGHA